MCTMYVQEPAKVRAGIGYPGTGFTDDCELLCRFLELNLGPLQECKHSFLLSHLSSPMG